VLAIEQAAKSAALLLDARESASEQPILVMSPSSRQAEEQAIPRGPERDVVPEPEAAALAQDEAALASTPVNIPKFLEAQPSDSGHSWLRWAVIAVIALVAAFAGIRILQAKFPGHLFAASRNTGNPAAPSSPPAGESVSSPAGSTSIPHPAPVIKNDRASSFQTLARRADRGDVAAQMDLAQAYLTGDNVPEDQEKAASWYIMAGENGSTEGKRRSIEITHGMAPFQIGEIRFDLGKMYMNGIGAAQDYVSAYAWFELAKAAGDIRAQAQQDTLEQKMDSGQVQEARQRASQWLQSHSRKGSAFRSGR
jgi:TPR repeat protein